MRTTFQPLDPENVPLTGTRLIEAGAGTGKTATITALYLRLILERGLLPENILVVTFTRAATEELKGRIRQSLTDVRMLFSGRAMGESPVARLAKAHLGSETALVRVRDALAGLDRAAVFTIHGFCQRLLTECAFETHTPFDAELVADPDPLLLSVADDFWRRNMTGAPLEFLAYLSKGGPEPAVLVDLLNACRLPSIRVLPDPFETAPIDLRAFRRALDDLRRMWRSDRDPVARALLSPGLNAVRYGGLKPPAGGVGPSTREIRVHGWLEDMDRYLEPSGLGFPLLSVLEKFSAVRLAESTNKGHTPPAHPFFHACDRLRGAADPLIEEMERYWLAMQRRFVDEARLELADKKAGDGLMFYDDMLLSVLKTLTGPWAGALKSIVRRRYRAVLVDEFQDTDSVQYQIFSRLFGEASIPLFLIGDPKQAIFGFRGADIFAYIQAADASPVRYTLTKNWRTVPSLIQAVNAVFSSRTAPFVFDAIPFLPAEAGLDYPRGTVCRESEPAPLQLWFFPGVEENGRVTPRNKAEASEWIAERVAREAARLLGHRTTTGPPGREQPVRPSSIAVLVRTNRQARIIKRHMTALRIPSVLFHSAHLLDTRESMEIRILLAAVSDPANETRFRAALATDLLGEPAAAFDTATDVPDWWETRMERFFNYRQLWRSRGFVTMFQRLLADEKIPQRLIGYEEGERRLTNVLHLAELLHRTADDHHLDMSGLLKWLDENTAPGASRAREDLLRLESDADAVRIVTIHKSKGLEYDIVFCPFCWEGLRRSGRSVVFHDPTFHQQLTVDIGSGNRSAHEKFAELEELAENLRLLYVALTRAKQRCYLAWGNFRTAETSALAYLFHGPTEGAMAADGAVGRLKAAVAARSEEEMTADLRMLCDRSAGTISLALVSASGTGAEPISPAEGQLERFRPFSSSIHPRWVITSYSALAAHADTGEVLPDRDMLTAPQVTLEAAPEYEDRTPEIGLASFPRGARAGIFFHELLEAIDFPDTVSAEEAARQRVERLVDSGLSENGFDGSWRPQVCAMLRRLAGLRLEGCSGAWSLGDLGQENRVNEMAFHFPCHADAASGLADFFRKAGPEDGFPGSCERTATLVPSSFMKGYIDMVFRVGKRYYLADWKSNHLGITWEDYRADRLTVVMREEQYVLQYHLYTVALDRYLRSRVSGYRYDTHFGGVYYFFIRGISEERGESCGVYFDRPKAEMVSRLGRLLTEKG